MTLRQYLSTMLFATVLCIVALVMVVLNVDPFETNSLGFIFFYTSAFLSIVGMGSLLLFGLYRFLGLHAVPLFKYVQKSFREACAVAAAGTLLLYLQASGLLRLWNFILLSLLALFIISMRFSMKDTRKSDYSE